MSVELRDYLAAHAPNFQIAQEHEPEMRAAKATGTISATSVLLERAKMAYEWADAMIQAREVKP